MKSVVIVSFLLLLGACGASFVGPATEDPGDPCKGRLSCAAGCCEGTADDGWECNPPGFKSPNGQPQACTFNGGINPGDSNGILMGSKRKDAGSDASK
jgi:hypothetical protein